MSENANKAMLFAVGLFVTLIVISGIINIFSQFRQIYSGVNSTSTSLLSAFSEFTQYENAQKTGLEVINCANKYYNENMVVVIYNGQVVNTIEGLNYINQERDSGNLNYDDLFRSIVDEAEYDGIPKTRITFIKI